MFSVALAALAAGCAVSINGAAPPPAHKGESAASGEVAVRPAQRTRFAVPRLRGRAIADLPPGNCLRRLRRTGIRFERVPAARADGVDVPVRLRGPVGAVRVEHRGRSRRHAILDCRLVLALAAWEPALREAGVTRIDHYSVYRPNARVATTGQRSGHAAAMAIDAARFHLDDGTVLDVLPDWPDKARGAPPCPPREDEPEGQHLLRTLVCDAAQRELFQVILTPHHDDAHRNHLHLELRPDVDWSLLE